MAVDLFAGSGALGVEALSRGAAHVTFVDDDRGALRAVRRNLDACGVADRATVVADRAERWLAALAPGTPRSTWRFCDPPYAYDGWAGLLAALPADLVVVESDGPVELPDGWALDREARYGGTWVGFASRPPRDVGDAMSGCAG